jgi:hypothetical protein
MAREFLMSIVSNIAASIIGFLAATVYFKYWKQWLRDVYYHGSDIEGKYTTTLKYDDGTFDRIVMTFKQYGYKVTAVMRCIEGCCNGSDFLFEGEIYSGIIYGTYRAQDHKKGKRGVLALKISSDGISLIGISSYITDTANDIKNVDVVLIRTSETNAATSHRV